MAFELSIAADIYGAKLNASFHFTAGCPSVQDCHAAAEAHFSKEARARRPAGCSERFVIDAVHVWNPRTQAWESLRSSRQFVHRGQVYCFQAESSWHTEQQGMIPDPSVSVMWPPEVHTPQPPAATNGTANGWHRDHCGSSRQQQQHDEVALRAGSVALAHSQQAAAGEQQRSRPRDSSSGAVAPHTRKHSTPAGPQPRPVVATPFNLCAVCNRGERELQGWRGERDSGQILGTYAELMAATAQRLFAAGGRRRGDLRVLSMSDGVSDDTQLDTQAKYVPTSVMLCHSFTREPGRWHEGRRRVRIFGGDMRNGVSRWWQQQQQPWVFPQWLEHRFVALDNGKDLRQQLHGEGQVEEGMAFDVVLMRHGLCFCDDPSKTSQTWPAEVRMECSWASAVCGVYSLEPQYWEGRPAYRMSDLLLQWSPTHGEWAILDSNGGAWAYARSDVGHPALARGPWMLWNGQSHLTDNSLACNLVHSPPPWMRQPSQRVCCSGMRGEASALCALFERAAVLLDPDQSGSFALLHGAWTNGTLDEVIVIHQEIEEAARRFNASPQRPSDGLCAAVLWRTAAKEYWLQCDGVIIYRPGSAADPLVQADRTA
eukprot:TRINITY_DN10993_c0_g1_i1.p1 TRINITY_DN10993_c0_g1~~TRINITY_DN10993_c0_g1_i1.p1  ORF type:complete len:599 (+),score=165.92 TRINITY_DN10993_c0_g1_i1:134-1930(+)